MKKKKCSTGGDLLSTAVSFIPGYGQLLQPLVLGLDNAFSKPNTEPKIPAKSSTNIYGFPDGGYLPSKDKSVQYTEEQLKRMVDTNKQQMRVFFKDKEPSSKNFRTHKFRFRDKKDGGFINEGFKQYKTGSHSSGNDLLVNQFGQPDNNSNIAVQNDENIFRIDNKAYVMSDTLDNPVTGNKFNVDAKKVNSKYKNSRFYEDKRNALNHEMKSLMNLNDLVRTSVEFQKRQGGFIDPPKTNTIFDLNLQVDNNVERYYKPDGTLSLDPQLVSYPESNFDSNNKNLSETSITNPTTQTTDRGIAQDVLMNNNLNPLALTLKGLALGKSAFEAMKSPEVEKPILPDYTKSDRYVKEANIDYTQARQNALGVSNIESNLNRSASNNFSQFANRESARLSSLLDQYGNVDMQQANQQSQLNLNKGQYEQQKSVDTANRLYQNRIDNQQNKAVADFAKEKFFSELSQVGTEFNKYQETRNIIENIKQIANFKNSQTLAYLNSKYPNVKISSDVIQKFQNGEIDVDNFLSYFPTNIQQDVRTNVKQI